VSNNNTSTIDRFETMTAASAQVRRQAVARRYRSEPGSAAEGALVEQYLPLVKTVVGKVAMTLPSHVDADDLHSAGVIGLLNALRNFDVNNGAKFETYARIRIQGAVLDELRRMDWQSRSIRDKARKVQAAMTRFEQEHGRPPTEAEMPAVLKLPVAQCQALLDEIRPVTFVCLDAALRGDDEENPSPYESVADPSDNGPVEGAAKNEMAALIAQRIRELPDMQRKVLALYYYEDMRLREIAEAFGLTESRICQIHSQAILSIKSILEQHGLRSTRA
jgi:RNA polymerase sigma factor for flagellar operon FliA